MPWRGIQEELKKNIPVQYDDRDRLAYELVPDLMNQMFGFQNLSWHTERRPAKTGGGFTTWVVLGPGNQ